MYDFKKLIPRAERGSVYVGIHVDHKKKISFSRGFCHKYNIEPDENFEIWVDVNNGAIRIYFCDSGEYATKKTREAGR